MPKLLILFSDTGGGHRAAAEAIRESIRNRYGESWQVVLEDGIVDGAIPPVNLIPKLYLPTTTYLPWAWGLLFNATNSRWGGQCLTFVARVLAGRGLRRLLIRADADLVVTVHPLLTRVPCDLWRRIKPGAPFVTVVTDLFDAHVTWFSAPADLQVVPTEGARERGVKWGFPPDRMRVVGLPVSAKFSTAERAAAEENPGAQRELRDRLGLVPDRFTILIVGGGEGMGQIEAITRALASSGLHVQLVVVAGRNRRLREKLEAERWPVPVRVTGFVSNMPDWMRASDLVITKAGPGTIMETLTTGRPLLLSGYLPGQEAGNVTYVVESGVGVYCDDPSKMVGLVREWLQPGNEQLERMKERARAQARPEAASEIAKLLEQLAVGGQPSN